MTLSSSRNAVSIEYQSEREFGQAGRLDYVNRHLMFPAFKPLPKVFAKPVGYLSFSSAADRDHDEPSVLQELH